MEVAAWLTGAIVARRRAEYTTGRVVRARRSTVRRWRARTQGRKGDGEEVSKCTADPGKVRFRSSVGVVPFAWHSLSSCAMSTRRARARSIVAAIQREWEEETPGKAGDVEQYGGGKQHGLLYTRLAFVCFQRASERKDRQRDEIRPLPLRPPLPLVLSLATPSTALHHLYSALHHFRLVRVGFSLSSPHTRSEPSQSPIDLIRTTRR